jgi:hypothetical protein
MSDQPHPTGNPDLTPETRLFILARARTLNRELLVRLYAADEDFESGRHDAVIGALVLADVQLQHLRSLVRILEA